MNRPLLRKYEKPKHINDYPVGPCFEAGYLVTENSGWRTKKPVVVKDLCIGCFYCYMCCPEGVILRKEKLIDIDYAFCKGCGICAKVCPKKAINMEREGVRMGYKAFLSGNEAVAEGVRLSKPHVIAAYPITPQTVVVERLAEMVEKGSLKSEFLHVESEHSALSACMGASSIGARTFTATSSQGLLYMAECLHYASGGRFPIVMMNANRSLALPWSIYGDHRDSMSLLDSGWIQVYAEDAQESLDMVIQSYAIAENLKVLTPVMLNLDGFVLTHTYELVDVPSEEEVDKFLPPFDTPYKMDLENPKNMGFSSSPADNMEFKYQQHKAVLDARRVIKEVDEAFGKAFGRSYGGLVDAYQCEDADFILVSLGSTTGTVRTVVDELREEGIKAGLVKIRFMRPFPEEEIVQLVRNTKAVGVIDRDISFGYEGTVFTNVNSALAKADLQLPKLNFIAGLGGRDISKEDIREAFFDLIEASEGKKKERVKFLSLGVEIYE